MKSLLIFVLALLLGAVLSERTAQATPSAAGNKAVRKTEKQPTQKAPNKSAKPASTGRRAKGLATGQPTHVVAGSAPKTAPVVNPGPSLAPTATPAPPPVPAAQVLNADAPDHTLTGKCTVLRQGTTQFVPLKPHDSLYAGDIVATASQGECWLSQATTYTELEFEYLEWLRLNDPEQFRRAAAFGADRYSTTQFSGLKLQEHTVILITKDFRDQNQEHRQFLVLDGSVELKNVYERYKVPPRALIIPAPREPERATTQRTIQAAIELGEK